MHTAIKETKRTRNRNNVLLALALLLALPLSIAIPSLHAAATGTAGTYVNQAYDTSAVIIRIAQSDPLPATVPTGATATATAPTNGGLLIKKAGTYRLNGTVEGQITVEADEDDDIVLILDGLTVVSTAGPALNIVSAKNVTIYLQPGTINTLTDTTDSDAAVLSKSDLIIYGNGTLLVNGQSSHGLVSKDDLVIAGGTIKVQAVADGIKGKDSITVSGAAVEIIAGGDGMQSYNEEDPARGYINIMSGTIKVTSTLDGIQGHTLVQMLGGSITIKTGGGSSSRASSESTKGIKAENTILIEGGTLSIDACDDALHSNHTITIKAGELNLSSGDDGIHAENTLALAGGSITITKSYEAVEGTNILISGGIITMNSSDDGINTVNQATSITGTGVALAGRPGAGGGFEQSDGSTFLMTGGTVYMNASGDGLDINGDGSMTGGTLIISGPTDSGNGAVDYNGSFKISGGTLVAAGSSGMAQAPGTGSTQSSVMLNLSSQKAGSVVAVKDSTGKVLMAFAPVKSFTNLVFSSPELVAGKTYTVVAGGTTPNTSKQGSLTSGSYTLGTQTATSTANLVVGAAGGFGQQPGQGAMPTGGARKTW